MFVYTELGQYVQIRLDRFGIIAHPGRKWPAFSRFWGVSKIISKQVVTEVIVTDYNFWEPVTYGATPEMSAGGFP
ncbi:hypothetical protein [Qipengyuania flava]|uniref:hypothetical protein n=1 Tax=Qipengyuania flava TaxID=192812 RepID=UPI00102E4652|nr:hypothetical protein [Qipengyuania flava]